MISSTDLHTLVTHKGCFTAKKNQAIYHKFFRQMPKYLYHNLVKYRLDQKKVLDVGCSFGSYLVHFGPQSMGLDINPEHLQFLKALGLRHTAVNIEDDTSLKPNQFEAIWSSNFLEHMVAPHFILLKFHKLLKKDGLIFIYCPTVSWKPFRRLPYFRDYLASEHINFFTNDTLAMTIERAGFTVLEVNSAFSYQVWLNQLLAPFVNLIFPGVTVVARKNNQFEYPEKRIPQFTPAWMKAYDLR